MGPDKLLAGSSSGSMGGAGDQAGTGCVRASELRKESAHHRNDVALRTLFAIYS